MRSWVVWMVSACMALACISAQAVELLRFDQPALGLPWNASPAQMKVAFPGIKEISSNSYTFRGSWNVGSAAYHDDVLLFSFDAAGLKQVYCSVPNLDALKLITTLDQRIGSSRSANYRVGKMFQHVHEWTGRDYAIRVRYLGSTADALSAPVAASLEAELHVSRDRSERSEVDAVLAMPKLAEEVNRRVLEEHERQKRAKAEKAQAAPPEPSPVNTTTGPPLRKAGTTWGAALNPGGAVPVGSFKAFYIRKSQPRTVVASEIVPDVAINYAYDQFHGIRSEDFGAYWVGKLKFDVAETRLISVSQSWAKTRVIIDGSVVYEGGSNASTPYQFSAGEHLIEVEYLNSWHTTEVRVAFNRQLALLNKDQVRGEMQRRGLQGLDVYYVGLYESNARDLGVAVNLGSLQRDSVLVLSSYSSIKWLLAGSSVGKVKAVIVGSYNPGSEVTGAGSKTAVLSHRGWISGHEFKSNCHCVGGKFHCESSQSLQALRKSVEDLTGGTLRSFSTAYGASAVSLPDQLISDESIEASNAEQQAIQQQRAECEKDPDFETIMQ